MIIKTVQTLVFEYPEDYQAEIEWNKKRDGDWVHQSRDTMCSVYTLTNNYLIPTKTKHSFLDNPYFEAEPRTEEPSFTATDFGKGTITRYTDEPQKDCKKCKNYEKCKNNKWKCCVYQPIEDEPQTEETEMDEYYKDHDEFYDCDRYVITNDEGERAYNCIGCERTDCSWK